ncbi:rho GTPase-activating protein 11A isoform X2 [Callorhinchus milii]|nr:rho GTPase-activating protein 11A isoform X2 [Callorhinchus milii]
MAPPCDVAGLVKCFFRELPEPVLPTELHEAFIKSQQLQNNEKIYTTILLSCLLPEKNANTLHYFLSFLKNVSLRSKDNKMDSKNLAVVFAPNFFHSGDGGDKVTALTEKRLQLQAAAVHTLIDSFQEIGHVPDIVLEKIPAMLGVDVGSSSSSLDNIEDGDGPLTEGCKRRRRRSVGDIVSGALSKLKANRTPSGTPQPDTSERSSATPIIMTPTCKRKVQVDSSHSLGFSNKKRRSLRQNLGFELLPSSSFLSQNSTPSSDGVKKDGVTSKTQFIEMSPQVALESLKSSLFLSDGSIQFQATASPSGKRRKSKRLENKKIERVESGKAGCFSPRVSRKEIVRKSLRLRFGLGKIRDTNMFSSGCSAPKRSENIGWRLANQHEADDSIRFPVEDLAFSPVARYRNTRYSKHVSKSEENLLTPAFDKDTHRMSWNDASPIGPNVFCDHVDMGAPLEGYLNSRSYQSEPFLVTVKPPTIPEEVSSQSLAKSKDCLDEAGNIVAGETVLKIKKAFSESGSNLCSLIEDSGPIVDDLSKDKLFLENQSFTPLKSTRSFEDLFDRKWSCSEFSSKPVAEIKCQGAKLYQCAADVSKTYDINNQNCINNVDQQNINEVVVLQEKELDLPSSAEDETNLKDKQTPLKCAIVPLLNKTEPPTPIGKTNQESSNFEQNENASTLVENLTPPKSLDTDVNHTFELHQPLLLTRELEPTLNQKTDVSSLSGGLESPSIAAPLNVPSAKILPNPDGETEYAHQLKVVEHIQRFNTLSLNDQTPKHTCVKLPLTFKRTSVRQSVKRMNSLCVKSTTNTTRSCKHVADSPVVKSVSHESLFSPCAESSLKHIPDSVTNTKMMSMKPNEKRNVHKSSLFIEGFCQTKSANDAGCSAAFKSCQQSTKQSVFEDLTNRKVSLKQDVIVEKMLCITPEKTLPHHLLSRISEKEKIRYKGSPKYPISAKLLAAKESINL